MQDELKKLHESVGSIQKRINKTPQVGIVLGSGLGDFVSHIENATEIRYQDIPHFPVSTVEGHDGKLIFGQMGGKEIVAMSGRFHFYEGYSAQEVVLPIRVMKLLGISNLFISNAAGGVNPSFRVGDLMVIRDIISFATINPLVGKNISELGPRFPDMSEPFNKPLMQLAKQIAATDGIKIHEGVYFGVTGPTFETRAEYKMIHILGGDAVGMSTVQEVIAANHMSLPVFAVSVITDLGIREEENIITHAEVLEAASKAGPILSGLFLKMISKL